MSDPLPRRHLRRPESPAERAARVDALRRALAAGTLCPTFSVDSPGLDRLLQALIER
ncbi:MAG: hypothetical protein R3F59_05075 [Myxococcota bacterium]